MISKFRVTDKHLKMEKQLIYLYITIYFFVKSLIFVWRLLEIWRSCRLLLQLAHKVPRYQIDERTVWLYPSLARRHKRIWFFQDLESLHLGLHRLIHPSARQVSFHVFQWFLFEFPDARKFCPHLHCWHRGSNILVKIYEIIWDNVTSKFLH